jgi:hypothetical protein
MSNQAATDHHRQKTEHTPDQALCETFLRLIAEWQLMGASGS